jgi:HD-like signal output (HDOD) protein
MPMEQKRDRLKHWITRLSESDMPVFAHTAETLKCTTRDTESSAAELARVILQDVSMTSRVLKLANSTFYNPAGRSISTVSRAVVVLGFETIRSLCFSIAMIESLLEGGNREHVVKYMAQAFHAAVQARCLAEQRQDSSPEEVFIATLLLNLGRIAFWCFGGEDAARLEQVMASRPELAPEQAEREALGFALRELTRGLSNEWHLSPLLKSALSGTPGDDPRVSNVTIAYEIAILAEQQGWRSEAMAVLMQHLADDLRLPVDQLSNFRPPDLITKIQ